jgi:hypothetical protein
LNVITGYRSTSRKFAERKSSSLASWLVRMLAAWMVASTHDFSGWSGSMSAVVVISSK